MKTSRGVNTFYKHCMSWFIHRRMWMNNQHALTVVCWILCILTIRTEPVFSSVRHAHSCIHALFWRWHICSSMSSLSPALLLNSQREKQSRGGGISSIFPSHPLLMPELSRGQSTNPLTLCIALSNGFMSALKSRSHPEAPARLALSSILLPDRQSLCLRRPRLLLLSQLMSCEIWFSIVFSLLAHFHSLRSWAGFKGISWHLNFFSSFRKPWLEKVSWGCFVQTELHG